MRLGRAPCNVPPPQRRWSRAGGDRRGATEAADPRREVRLLPQRTEGVGKPPGASRASSRGVGVGGPRARAAIPRRGGPRAPTRGDPSGGSRTAVDRARQRPVRHPRPGLRRVRALVLQTLLGLPQRLAPPLTGAQLLGSSSPRARSVELVLPPVDVQRLGEDLPRDLAEIAVGVHRRVGRHVRAINRHDADRHKPVRAHKPSTPENASASGRSCRQRDSAIVE
jgi:hypothetical protein